METETNFFIVDGIIHKDYGKVVEGTIKEYATFREEHDRIVTEYIAFLRRDVVARMTSTLKTKTENKEFASVNWRKYGF